MTAPRPVSQLHQMTGTMRAQRLMKLVPSQEMYSQKSESKTMHHRMNTVNGFYKNGRLRNIKIINDNQQDILTKQESESFSNTKDLMYLATNDVQSGDY